MLKRGAGCAALGLILFAGAARAVEVQVAFSGDGRAAQIRLSHAPDREPLAALRIRLRIKTSAGLESFAVTKPESGPWSQFLPRAALEGQAITAWAMAPATGAARDSALRPIAVFDLALAAGAAPAAAADLIDSALVLEAYGYDGGKLSPRVSLTTGVMERRARPAPAAFTRRGKARTLAFNLGRPQRVRAWISDMRGRRVADVLDRKLPAGIQEVTWDGRASGGGEPARGLYLFHLEAGTFSYDRKVEVAP